MFCTTHFDLLLAEAAHRSATASDGIKDVAIRGGKIARSGRTSCRPARGKVVDVRGQIVCPD